MQLNKLRARQKDTKSRHDQMVKDKRTKLNDKIIHARENRNMELSNIKMKAQMDIQSVEDIKYIMRTMQSNLQMDINNKLSETEERRNLLMASLMKKLEEQKVKENEAHKRRIALTNSKQEEIRKAEARRRNAQQRKQELIKEKKRTDVNQKREQVLQRKTFMGA